MEVIYEEDTQHLESCVREASLVGGYNLSGAELTLNLPLLASPMKRNPGPKFEIKANVKDIYEEVIEQAGRCVLDAAVVRGYRSGAELTPSFLFSGSSKKRVSGPKHQTNFVNEETNEEVIEQAGSCVLDAAVVRGYLNGAELSPNLPYSASPTKRASSPKFETDVAVKLMTLQSQTTLLQLHKQPHQKEFAARSRFSEVQRAAVLANKPHHRRSQTTVTNSIIQKLTLA